MYGIFRVMRRAVATSSVLAICVFGCVFGTLACKGPMAKIDALRDALVAGDDAQIKRATEGYPTCPEVPPAAVAPGQPGPRDKGCLADIANALGSKMGFRAPPVDQASAATAALVLVREGRGDYVAHPDVWLGAIKSTRGSGVDALRLATARKMAEAAPLVGRSIDEDSEAVSTLAAIAGAVPGACPTYQLLGAGVDPVTMRAELTPEHSACVHKDLSRREGKGPSYGEGIFRALEGALALWRETERALRLGLAVADAPTKRVLEEKLVTIEQATQKNATKKFDSTVAKETVLMLGDLHAEAGVVLFRVKDAGQGASADAAPDGGL